MNIERLERLKTIMEGVNSKDLIMSVWAMRSFGGFCGCVAGHACQNREFNDEGLIEHPILHCPVLLDRKPLWRSIREWIDYVLHGRQPPQIRLGPVESIMKFFDLTETQYRKIFTPSGYSYYDPTNYMVIDNINSVIKSNMTATGLFDRILAETDDDRRSVLVDKTYGFREHPVGYDGPCKCDLCRSYSDG